MKVWRLDYHDDDAASGQRVAWFTSKRAARRHGRQLDRDYASDDRECPRAGYFRQAPRAVDVPTTRAALADFLTRYEP